MLMSIDNGKNIGLLSEAGCPNIADPGADIVKLHTQKELVLFHWLVRHQFSWHLWHLDLMVKTLLLTDIYQEKKERKNKILFLENLSFKKQQTQIFIETPFRNNHVLEDLCKYCKDDTVLVIATNISTARKY